MLLLTWRSRMTGRLTMGRRNHRRSRRLPAGLTQRLSTPNALKPSLGLPMPIADGWRSSCSAAGRLALLDFLLVTLSWEEIYCFQWPLVSSACRPPIGKINSMHGLPCRWGPACSGPQYEHPNKPSLTDTT